MGAIVEISNDANGIEWKRWQRRRLTEFITIDLKGKRVNRPQLTENIYDK